MTCDAVTKERKIDGRFGDDLLAIDYFIHASEQSTVEHCNRSRIRVRPMLRFRSEVSVKESAIRRGWEYHRGVYVPKHCVIRAV